MRFFSAVKPIVAAAFGLMLGLLVCKLAGESPWHVLQILSKSAFGSRYDFGMTLFYATPLIFTGLSVSLAFHAGLFNIGAEGQLTMGAMGAAVAGILFKDLAAPWGALLGITAAFLAGALWGLIPGVLKAWRGSHEVINTIMLNFIAVGLTSWATLYLFRNTNSQNPETASVGEGFVVPHISWFEDAPVSLALPLALLVALLFWFFLWKTARGFEFRAVGENETAARIAGIESRKVTILAMALAGGIAGLVGVAEVMGNAGRFKVGFSPGFGFLGIAVALLGRNRPVGILAAALLFGALHKGTSDLDMETQYITRDLSLILQALVILAVSADGIGDGVRRIRARWKRKAVV